MSIHVDRLAALRQQMRTCRLDGFLVPLTDEHLSEYVGDYAHRLGWLTGFTGTAGTAVVLPEQAAMFVDGRYTLQVREQVEPSCWSFQSIPQTSIAEWLSVHAAPGSTIGYDHWLHTRPFLCELTRTLKSRNVALKPVTSNIVDEIWDDQPMPATDPFTVQPDQRSGQASDAKRQDIADWLAARGADAVALASLDSVAWTLNIRGSDVSHTPVGRAYALVNVDATADLFVDVEKVPGDVRAHLGMGVRIHELAEFRAFLSSLNGKTVAVDPDRSAEAIFSALEASGANLLSATDPAFVTKAVKNDVEITGHRSAQARDGAVLARFLHWLSLEVPRGKVDEIVASDKLLSLRQEDKSFRGLSFATISGSGPNGAIVHYNATQATRRPLDAHSIYLIDSGGQYLDGTTDVTRTISFGEVTLEVRKRFTLVLKGHIAIAQAIFPVGTCGVQLDTLARQYLWRAGLDYDHGTGHGVGSYLNVHEGPQRIAAAWSGHPGIYEPLRAGMILSNEPGYYKAGQYGIRIENLVLVVPADLPNAERPMLGFETLTFVPIDRNLIAIGLLTSEERQWVDDYHRRVLKIVGPLVGGDCFRWLCNACRPLEPLG